MLDNSATYAPGGMRLDVVGADVDLEQDLFYLDDHELVTGDQVRYERGADGTVIGGLEHGKRYLVDRVNGDQIRLRDITSQQVVNISAGASIGSVHKLQKLSTKVVRTLQVDNNTIDLTTDEIVIKDHGLNHE